MKWMNSPKPSNPIRRPSVPAKKVCATRGCSKRFSAPISGENNFALVQRAYGYHGQQLTYPQRAQNGPPLMGEVRINEVDQFANEMDEFAKAIKSNTPTKCPGEEGLRDTRLLEAILRS